MAIDHFRSLTAAAPTQLARQLYPESDIPGTFRRPIFCHVRACHLQADLGRDRRALPTDAGGSRR